MKSVITTPEYQKRFSYVMQTIGFQSRHMNLLRDEKGGIPLVIALPNEPMNDVIARLQDAGGAANIVVAYAKRVVIFPLTASSPAGEIEELPVSKSMSIGMFLSSTKKHEKGKSFKLVLKDRDFEAEYTASDSVFEYASA